MDELSPDEGTQREKYDPDVGHLPCEQLRQNSIIFSPDREMVLIVLI